MATKGGYNTYVNECAYENQSFYFEKGQDARICAELRMLGSKRVLIISSETVSSYKNVVDFIHKIEAEGFRTFFYTRRSTYSSSSDISGAASVYREFNCDTIVVFGGSIDIFCAKMVSGMVVNNIKEPSELSGYGKLKKDISVLCCVGMDNSTAISSNIAEFRDEKTGRWVTVLSNYLVPQIAVVDTDIAMRTYTKDSISSALDSLVTAVECSLMPINVYNPVHKACAHDAISLVADNLMNMKKYPDDAFLRKKVATAGIYAGTAVRSFGLGYAHILTNVLKTRYGPEYDTYYPHIMSNLLEGTFELVKGEISRIYNELVKDEVRPCLPGYESHLVRYYNEHESARAFIEILKGFYRAANPDAPWRLNIDQNHVAGICEEVRATAAEFGQDMIDLALLQKIVTTL